VHSVGGGRREATRGDTGRRRGSGTGRARTLNGGGGLSLAQHAGGSEHEWGGVVGEWGCVRGREAWERKGTHALASVCPTRGWTYNTRMDVTRTCGRRDAKHLCRKVEEGAGHAVR
jgi:hypothetical protein